MNRRNFLRSSIAAGVGAALPASQLYAALRTLGDVPGVIVAKSGTGSEIVLDGTSVADFANSLRGSVLLQGADGYDKARRVLNRGIDKSPALIVQPMGVTDIRRAVDYARDNELLVAVKCGGHSYSGKSTCNNGMQVDLSTFRHVRCDPVTRTADVAGGSLLGEIDREAMSMGLVTTAGTVSHTGVGGLTTGGGFGRVGRRFGLALDNVRSVDVVTADGKLVHASAEQNEDLYWGVRGGGGNFGIVTNFEFALHPMNRKVIAGDIFFPAERTRDVLALYADMVAAVPDELYLDVIMVAPPAPAPGIAGFLLCYSGDPGRFEKIIEPIRKLGTPLVDTVQATDYVAEQARYDTTDPRNEASYLKSGFFNEVSGELVDTIAGGFAADPGRTTMMYFQHSGGAINRVAPDATAFAHRKSISSAGVVVTWPLETDGSPHVDYLRDFWGSVERYTDGWYTNDVADQPERVVHGNYQDNYERLLAVKNRYDPGNLFRLNANIKPSA